MYPSNEFPKHALKLIGININIDEVATIDWSLRNLSEFKISYVAVFNNLLI